MFEENGKLVTTAETRTIMGLKLMEEGVNNDESCQSKPFVSCCSLFNAREALRSHWRCNLFGLVTYEWKTLQPSDAPK